MPQYIKPTLSITSNKNSVPAAQSPGPLSIALSLNCTDTLSVDNVQSEIVTVSSGSPTKLLDGSNYTPGVGGTAGAFLFLKNVSAASTTNVIYVGTDTGAADDLDDNTGSLGTGADSKRLATLKVGEFMFLPYDYCVDINIDSNAADQTLEYWLFDRGA